MSKEWLGAKKGPNGGCPLERGIQRIKNKENPGKHLTNGPRDQAEGDGIEKSRVNNVDLCGAPNNPRDVNGAETEDQIFCDKMVVGWPWGLRAGTGFFLRPPGGGGPGGAQAPKLFGTPTGGGGPAEGRRKSRFP